MAGALDSTLQNKNYKIKETLLRQEWGDDGLGPPSHLLFSLLRHFAFP